MATPSPARACARAHGDETELFARYASSLERGVASVVATDHAIVQDACAIAWLQLLRYQPQRISIAGWLRTVAVREAIRLDRRARRDAPLRHDPRSDDPLARYDNLDATWAALGDLRRRHATMVVLQAIGLSYREISASTGDSQRTVERQLRRAHAALKQARRTRERPAAAA